jgi:hypothetical protein
MSGRPIRTAVVTAVAVLAALAAGTALNSALPSADDVGDAPFVATDVVGQQVHLRTGELTVLGVDASTTITGGLGQAISEQGTFLIVKLRWVASPKPQPLSGTWVRAANGRTYHAGSPVTAGCAPAQTGIPVVCQLVFEMPKSALAGAVLVAPSEAISADADLQARIDLGIDPALASTLAEKVAEVTVPLPQEGTP